MSEIHIRRAVDIIRRGGVIAYPTESVYGLGCDPQNQSAVEKILEIKRRSPNKGLILIASDIAQIAQYTGALSDKVLAKISATWPGPVTWILPERGNLPTWLKGTHGGIAIRVTAHPIAADLCRRFGGAIVSTSANRSGKNAAKSAIETRLRLNNDIDYIVPGAVGGLNKPTEIRDALTDRVIRPSK